MTEETMTEQKRPFDLSPRLWFTLFLIVGVLASAVADALFSATAIAILLLSGCVLCLRCRVSSLFAGLGLGTILLVCAMLCWLLGEMASGGNMHTAPLVVLRILLAEFFGGMLFFLLQPKKRRGWEIVRRIVTTFVLLTLFSAVVLYLTLTGPTASSPYPAPESSPYRLPWSPGVTYLCIQSNRGIVSHRDSEEYAFDFAMPLDTVFCAARAGTVFDVVDEYDGNGTTAPNNYIYVQHDDRTLGVYLHLRQGGSLVVEGQRVEQGTPLGYSGNVGRSMLPHLHFHVQSKGRTIPITFTDVPGDGIPRMLQRYTSHSSD
jgi:hypothetical protein